MDNKEFVKYFYENIVSKNELDKLSQFISKECTLRIGEDIVNIGFLDTLFFNVENDLLSVGDGLYINSLLYGESIYVY